MLWSFSKGRVSLLKVWFGCWDWCHYIHTRKNEKICTYITEFSGGDQGILSRRSKMVWKSKERILTRFLLGLEWKQLQSTHTWAETWEVWLFCWYHKEASTQACFSLLRYRMQEVQEGMMFKNCRQSIIKHIQNFLKQERTLGRIINSWGGKTSHFQAETANSNWKWERSCKYRNSERNIGRNVRLE